MDGSLPNSNDELASLEAPAAVVQPGASSTDGPHMPPVTTSAPGGSRNPLLLLLRWFAARLNIYLALFLILIVASGVAGTAFYFNSAKSTVDTLPQSLPQSTLDQLTTSDVNVGEPKHTLSVQSNAVFSGDVLVRDNLQIAGSLQVGSNLAIAGLRVTGNSTFDDVQVTKSLALTGNGSVQGTLDVQKNLSVNGNGSFLGALSAPTLTVTTLQLNGDLILTHHISAGGSTPGRSNGSALGSGGTASVSGSDTAGTVTINTGSSPSVGCFVTVAFAAKFNSTPHMSLTPASAAAADLSYYVTRGTTNFSVCTDSIPPAGATIIYDYVALD